MAITRTAEAVEAVARPAVSKGEVVVLKPPRLPYHEAVQERFGVDRAGWKALVEAIYPNAKTADSVIMALSYCRARNLDPFKRPVHIVPMWSSAVGAMVETVWPGISELRTTAFRTGQYAGMAPPEFGPEVEMTFAGTASRGHFKGQERSITLKFPEWCRITITRELNGKERAFVGPKAYWLEAYAQWADTDVPNDMWVRRAVGQLEKCAEAAALRRAFPEEIGNDYAAEEMEGQRLIGETGPTPEKPKPETVMPPTEQRPLPPVVPADKPEPVTESNPSDLEAKQDDLPLSLDRRTSFPKRVQGLLSAVEGRAKGCMTLSELAEVDEDRKKQVQGLAAEYVEASERIIHERKLIIAPPENAEGGEQLFDPVSWLKELDGAFAGCADANTLVEERKRLMDPHKEQSSAEDRDKAEALFKQHFHRILTSE